MKKKLFYLFALLFSVFVHAFVSFGDYVPNPHEPNWPVYLGPEEECEEVVAYLKDSVDSIVRDLSGFETYTNDLSYSHQQIYEMAAASPAYTNDESYSQNLYYYNDVFQNAMILCARDLRYANEIATNLFDDVYQINCADCVMGDQPEGPTNSNACCDFTGLYARLDELIRLQTSIESNVQRLRTIDQNLQYSVFLLEHGFGDVTNLLINAYYALEEDYNPYGERYWSYDRHGTWYQEHIYLPDEEPYSLVSLVLNSSWNLAFSLASINNVLHDSVYPALNSIKSPSPLLYFDAEVEERDYYTFLTNYYFAMVRGDSDIAFNHKTNWFTRIETLLAALVFADGAKTNYYESATYSFTNSIQQVKEEFTNLMDGISQSPTDQMQLVESVERSMYENLRSFSSAFSDASLPSSVQIIHVHKGLESRKGSRLLSTEEIDVSADISGRLMDFLEILRSATTFCWVFLGLWFMFKFAVWTVKKIYVLIRYVIDFFNMIVGGK